jgi:hypothetical protein
MSWRPRHCLRQKLRDGRHESLLKYGSRLSVFVRDFYTAKRRTALHILYRCPGKPPIGDGVND